MQSCETLQNYHDNLYIWGESFDSGKDENHLLRGIVHVTIKYHCIIKVAYCASFLIILFQVDQVSLEVQV